jgi:ferric-dicitrate binding protein FerR (iron transport regulator)
LLENSNKIVSNRGFQSVYKMTKEDSKKQNSILSWLKKNKWIILIVLLTILLLCVVGYFYFKRTTTSFVNQTDKVATVKINRSISATLAIGSSFKKIEDTTHLTLQFQVQGNAYFEIQPTELPVVLIGDNGIVFSKGGNIMIMQREKSLYALVLDGEAVISKSLKRSFNEGLNLSKNEVGQVSDNIEGILKRVNRNPNYTAWLTKKIVFEGTLLSEALNLLEEVYGQKVQLPSAEVGECRVVGTFENASFEEVLYKITQDINLTVSKNEIEYNLEGVGCL